MIQEDEETIVVV